MKQAYIERIGRLLEASEDVALLDLIERLLMKSGEVA